LASNSLLECLVYGQQLRNLRIVQPASSSLQESDYLVHTAVLSSDLETLSQIRTELPDVAWQGAGISRCETAIAHSLVDIDRLRDRFDTLLLTNVLLHCLDRPAQYPLVISVEDLRLWTETRNLLTLGRLILKSARFRQESRGGHYREDYPDTDPAWQVHTVIEEDLWQKRSQS
jgi:L-aspartate oxidase